MAGEISGNLITFGAQQQVPGNAVVGNWDFDLVYDESRKNCGILLQPNNSERLQYCVMQWWHYIYFWSPTVINSSDCEGVSAAYDSGNQRVVFLRMMVIVAPHVYVGTVDPSNNSISGLNSTSHRKCKWWWVILYMMQVLR